VYRVHQNAQFVLNSQLTGSQCNCWSAAVTWTRRFRFKISLAAALWTRCSGASVGVNVLNDRVLIVSSVRHFAHIMTTLPDDGRTTRNTLDKKSRRRWADELDTQRTNRCKTGTPPLRGELMVLLQGGVNLFQGENSTPTGWLDKPLARGVKIPFRYSRRRQKAAVTVLPLK